MQTDDGELYVVSGKSRSGKTGFTAQEVVNDKRIIAWDPEDQWAQLPGWKRITSKMELLDAIKNRGAAKLAYVVGGDLVEEFDFWAWCVFFWLRNRGACTAIAEELADVTSTAKASGNWGVLIRRGLKRGLRLFCLSQRWAEADKTALGNPTFIVCCSMMPMDVKYISTKTGIKEAELASLKVIKTTTTITCPFIKLNFDSGQIERGKMVFRKKK